MNLKKAVIKAFNIDIKKNKFNKKAGTEWLHQPQSIMTDSVAADLPEKKVSNGGVAIEMSASIKNPEEKKKETVESHKEKEQKDIEGSLAAMKAQGSKDVKNTDTLESKMPSRTEKPEEENNYEPIKIPRRKILGGDSLQGSAADLKKPEIPGLKMKSVSGEQGGGGRNEIELPASSKIHDTSLFYDKDKIEAARKTLGDARSSGRNPQTQGTKRETTDNMPYKEGPENSIGEEDNGRAQKAMPNQQKNQNGIMFEGKPEVSRRELKYELKKDPKIWQINRDMRLNLSRSERASLVEDIFPTVYGSNISKGDLKKSVRKLGRKMMVTGDAKEHAKLKKEIKFFKKIGGIK